MDKLQNSTVIYLSFDIIAVLRVLSKHLRGLEL